MGLLYSLHVIHFRITKLIFKQS